MRPLGAVLGLVVLTSIISAQELSPEMAKLAERHYKAGVELMSTEKWDKAVEEFRSAIAIDKLMALAHYNVGQCRMAQQRFGEAVLAYQASRNAFEQIATLSQKEREERERLRRDELIELKDDLQRLQRGVRVPALTAARMEDRVRQLEWMHLKDRAGEFVIPAGVYLALGSAYFRQGKLEDAEREYKAAIDANAKLGEAHNNLAVVLFLKQRLDDARSELELAKRAGFRVDPRFEEDLRNASGPAKGTK